MGAHFRCGLVDVHSMELWMERRAKLWMTQQAHSGPQHMGLWLQDLLVSQQKYKGASCLWGMDTNWRDESALSTLQRCTRVRGQNPAKPALPMGNISSLIISTCVKTPQNEANFFFFPPKSVWFLLQATDNFWAKVCFYRMLWSGRYCSLSSFNKWVSD